jgi:quercetin dioxygenase-like cupin family protein
MPNLLVALTSLLVMTGASCAAQGDTLVRAQDGNLASAASPPPADHPVGTNASVSLVSLKRARGLSQPIFSTYIVAYAPGGSAVLHRSPTSGYVLVHVLSGAIRAQAWEAGMGVYLTGETWVEPAFASDITTKNASADEPARALVVLITNDTDASEREDK